MEVRLLSDPVYTEEFDVIVNELTDQYVAGAVEGAERDQMERYFFASPARREKLRIAAALKERQQAAATKTWLSSPGLRIAASILIIVGLALAVRWALTDGESEFDKGMAALQTAYRDGRPIEPRVSELSYSRFSTTRGAALDNQRAEQLRGAQLHLEQAVREKPTPEAHHALGKVYLAQGKPDEAIREFEQALNGSRNQVQIYNDLGVAWLQKEDFARSLDNFNKALQLDGNSLEALFNRALCYERQSRVDAAKAAWNEYLKHDSTSNWAYEANQHLIRLSMSLIY